MALAAPAPAPRALRVMKMHYLGPEEGYNYKAIEGIVRYLDGRYNIMNENFTTIDRMWEAMKDGQDKREPTQLVIVDLDFFYQKSPSDRQAFMSRLASYPCYKVGLSSSKRERNPISKANKETNEDEFKREAHADKLEYKPLTPAILQGLIKTVVGS